MKHTAEVYEAQALRLMKESDHVSGRRSTRAIAAAHAYALLALAASK